MNIWKEIKKQDDREGKENIPKEMKKGQKDLEFYISRRETKFKDSSSLKRKGNIPSGLTQCNPRESS